MLSRALADPALLTAAQLASASALAELLAQPARAQALRLRFARLEAARAAALAAEIDAALGRTAVAPSNGRLENQEAENGAASSPHRRTRIDSRSPRRCSRI